MFHSFKCATMKRFDIKMVLLIGILFGCFFAMVNGQPVRLVGKSVGTLDTVFANNKLPHSDLVKDVHVRYATLIYANHSYKSIKLLDREVITNGNTFTVVQKLYDGASVNIDSVLIEKNTLAPIESYSNISTSLDSFGYHGNRVKGMMIPIAGGKQQSGRNVDTLLAHPLFNGLAYIETYQVLNYKKGVPFILGQYVPGHNVTFERVEYVSDEKVSIAGVEVPAIKLNIQKTSQVSIQCWLNAKSHEVLKIEGQFPAFTYSLVQVAD